MKNSMDGIFQRILNGTVIGKVWWLRPDSDSRCAHLLALQDSVHFLVGGLQGGAGVHLPGGSQFQGGIELFEDHQGGAGRGYFGAEFRLPQVDVQCGVGGDIRVGRECAKRRDQIGKL